MTEGAPIEEELGARRLNERVYKLLGFVVTKARRTAGMCSGRLHPRRSAGRRQRREGRQVANNAEIWRIFSKLHQSAGDSKMVLECQLRRQRALQSAGPFLSQANQSVESRR